MNIKKLEEIFELIINDLPLTNQSLKKIGFSSEEINELVETKILNSAHNDKYELNSAEKFYHYGVKLALTGFPGKASICFEKCHKLEPENIDVCFQLALWPLKNGNYQKFFEVFPIIDANSSLESTKTNNIYLYLLNMITKIPEEYFERVKGLELEDYVYFYDNAVSDKKDENVIRLLIMNNKNKLALKVLNDIIAQENEHMIRKLVLKELIIQTIKLEEKFKHDLLSLTRNGDYKKIVAYLETKAKKRSLKNSEIYIYLVAKAIVKLLETKEIPVITADRVDSLYGAIKANNFEIAARINYSLIKRDKATIENHIIDILLSDMLDLSLKIELTQKMNLDKEGPTLIKKYNNYKNG